jgi:hypothetical protein
MKHVDRSIVFSRVNSLKGDLLKEEEGDEVLDVAAIREAVPAMEVVNLEHPRHVQQPSRCRLNRAVHLHVRSVDPPPRLLHHCADRRLPRRAMFFQVALHGAGHILHVLSPLHVDAMGKKVTSHVQCRSYSKWTHLNLTLYEAISLRKRPISPLARTMSGTPNAHSNASLDTTWPAAISATKNRNGTTVDISVTSTCSLKPGTWFSLNHLVS